MLRSVGMDSSGLGKEKKESQKQRKRSLRKSLAQEIVLKNTEQE